MAWVKEWDKAWEWVETAAGNQYAPANHKARGVYYDVIHPLCILLIPCFPDREYSQNQFESTQLYLSAPVSQDLTRI